MEALKEQVVITPDKAEDFDKEMQRQAYMERKQAKEQASEKKPWEVQLEKDLKIEEEKKKKEPKEEAKEQEKKEEVKVEEKPKEEPKQEIKAEESKPADASTQPLETKPVEAEVKPEIKKLDDTAVREYALKEGLTFKEAKEELEGIEGIVKKYARAEELAKAYRRTQSAYDRLKSEAEAQQRQGEIPKLINNPRGYVTEKVRQNQDKLVELYRAEYPAKSRDMDDEQIIEDLVDRYSTQYETQLKEFAIRAKQDALTRREEFLAQIPERDKRYLADIKATLYKIPDHTILSNSFDLNDLVYWVRGKYVDDEIREAQEKAKRNVSEEKRILGQVPAAETATKPVIKNVEKKSTLTEYQKSRAREMYDGTSMSEDEMYSEYEKILADKDKKKK